MKSRNVTLSLPSEILDAGRRYARSQGRSLNGLLRELLTKAVGQGSSELAIDDLFAALDDMSREVKKGAGKNWKREDAYDRER